MVSDVGARRRMRLAAGEPDARIQAATRRAPVTYATMAGGSDTVWVAELLVSIRTEQKIVSKHRIMVREVEQGVVCVVGLRGSWDHDPVRGRRLLLLVTIRGRPALVVLYPTVDTGVWNLGSAYFRS